MTKIFDNFELQTKKPLDKRQAVNTLNEINLPYEGMLTYQKSDKKYYKFEDGSFSDPFKSISDLANAATLAVTQMQQTIENIENDVSDMVARGNIIKNVKSFGAKGDGTTNDTTAIQTLLNQGGLIYIPSGTYIVDGLNVMSNTYLFGDGDTSIIKLSNGKNTATISAIQKNNITIKSLYIDCNKANQSGGYGIYFHTIDKLMLDNINLVNAKDHGITFWQSVTKTIVNNCSASNCGGCGLRSVFGTSDIKVYGGYYSYNGLSGILLESAPNALIIGAKTFYNTAGGEDSNGISIQSENMTVIGCESYKNYNAGIYSISNGSVIIGNNSHDNLLGCDLYNGGTDRRNFIIANNHFHYNSSKGHSAYWCQGIICTNNLIHDNGAGKDHGVEYDSCKLINFTNNTLYYNGAYGINLRSSVSGYQTNDIIIQGNYLNLNSSGAYNVSSECGNVILIRSNLGYAENNLSQPTLPSSGNQVVNNFHRDVNVYVSGGTVTDIQINTVSLGVTSGLIKLCPNDAITLVYSAAPTWKWFIQ